jgi:hypothetical protein
MLCIALQAWLRLEDMMNSTTSKAQWLDRIEQARAAWEEIASEVSEVDVDRPGATGDWTFKDVAAHLNSWRILTVARLEAAAGDKSAPPMPWPDGMSEETDEGTQEINEWFYERNRDRSAGEILAESRDQFRRIQAAIEAIPENELEAKYPWLEGYPISAVIEGTLEHLHVDHEPSIRAWIAGNPDTRLAE